MPGALKIFVPGTGWVVVPTTGLTRDDADARYVNVGGDTLTGPLVLPGDPTLALQAAPKQYVDRTVRWRGTRASGSFPASTDSAINLVQAVNLGGFVLAGNVVTVPEDGTYLASCSIGGAAHSAGSCIMITCPSHGQATVPVQTGTGWRSVCTVVATCVAGETFSFTYRNGGAASTQAGTVEIVRVT